MSDKKIVVELDSSELATVLAALRHWQQDRHHIKSIGMAGLESLECGQWDIASEHGEPLSIVQIDDLCERLNCAQVPEVPVIVIEGGVVQNVFVPTGDNRHPCKGIDYSLIDYDNLRDAGMSDEDFVDTWVSFSPALKKYYRQHCKYEFEKYFQARLDEACDCDNRSWYGPGHDSACPAAD